MIILPIFMGICHMKFLVNLTRIQIRFLDHLLPFKVIGGLSTNFKNHGESCERLSSAKVKKKRNPKH